MVKYPWKGNIRELENMIERAVVLTQQNILELFHFPILAVGMDDAQKDLTFEIGMSLTDVEKSYIQRTLNYYNDDKQKASKTLQIGLATLYRKIKEYGLE
jgi:DNA-binding NtrC family response regulator